MVVPDSGALRGGHELIPGGHESAVSPQSRAWPHGNDRFNGRLQMMIAHRWERNLKDVGDQALMRGLGTAVPSIRPGLSRSYNGRRLKAGHKAVAGHSPAAVPPPPVREIHPPAGG
jgi:hypothetical protein